MEQHQQESQAAKVAPASTGRSRVELFLRLLGVACLLLGLGLGKLCLALWQGGEPAYLSLGICLVLMVVFLNWGLVLVQGGEGMTQPLVMRWQTRLCALVLLFCYGGLCVDGGLAAALRGLPVLIMALGFFAQGESLAKRAKEAAVPATASAASNQTH